MTFRRATKIQSILFARTKWTVAQAKRWLRDHDKKVPVVDSTEKYHRFRQASPNSFVKGKLRTINLGAKSLGIKAIIGVPKRISNPTKRKTTVRLPRKVVSLGRCVELNFDDGRVWKPGRGRIELCASESGKTLWLLPVSREKLRKKPRSKLYERYTGYMASGIRTARVREIKSLVPLGYVDSVVYESDKWDNKKREYIHTFKKQPKAYVDNPNDMTFVKISGGRIRVKSEGIIG